MATAAYLPWPADRFTPCVRTIRVVGYDLTGVVLRMEARLYRNAGGAPLFALSSGVSAGAQGIRLVSVTTTAGIPTSVLEVRINKATMDALPYGGPGEDIALEYDLIFDWGTINAKRRLFGPLLVLAGVTGADAAVPTAGGGSASQLAAWGEATLTFDDGDVTVELDDHDRLEALIAAVQAYLQRQVDTALATFDLQAQAALSRFNQRGETALDTFGVQANGAFLDFSTRLEGRVVVVEARINALALGIATTTSVDLTNPNIAGLLPLTTDGNDPGGVNADRINATLAQCAASGLTVKGPAGKIVGAGKQIIIPSNLVWDCEPGFEIRRVFTGLRLFTTIGAAFNVRISGLRWRGMAGYSGQYFGGSYTDSTLSDLDHLGSFGAGLAFAWDRLVRTKVYRPRCRNMEALAGAGGSRWQQGGLDSFIIDADIESGDDAIQMVPAAGSLGTVFDNCWYIRSRGVSALARGLIISTGPTTNTVFRNSGALDGHWTGGGWPISIGAKSHFPYPVAGKITSSSARLAFSSVSRRGRSPIQATEIVTVNSPSTPARTFTSAISNVGANTFVGRLVFSAASKTITAPDSPNAFASYAIGDYAITFDGAGVNGPNDGFFGQITAKIAPDILQFANATAPTNEDSVAYTLTDAINFSDVASGQADGTLPADTLVRRTNPPTMERIVVTGVADAINSIRPTAVSFNGLIYGSRLDVFIENPRSQLLGVKDGGSLPSGNVLKVRATAPPFAWNGLDPLVDVQYTIGTELVIEAVAAPGQDGIFIRSKTDDYDDEATEVLYNTALAQSVVCRGVIQNLASQAAAVRSSLSVQRTQVIGMTAVAASGVTDAQLAFFAAGSSGLVSLCDLVGIASGNTLENAIKIQPTAAVRIANDNLAIPGYSLAPGAVLRGTATAGQTVITLSGSVPTSFADRLQLIFRNVEQDPGIDFTTDGTANVTLGFAMAAGDTYRVRHRS